MIGLLLRGCFLIGIISWYSVGVWKQINKYFGNEYNTYLEEQYRSNKHLRPTIEDKIKIPISIKEPLEDPPLPSISEAVLDKDVKTFDYTNHQQQSPPKKRQKSNNCDCFVNKWLNDGASDNADNNLHCQLDETACET